MRLDTDEKLQQNLHPRRYIGTCGISQLIIIRRNQSNN
jgi:hypothetical protein